MRSSSLSVDTAYKLDYLAWRLFSPGDDVAKRLQNPLEAANKLVGGRCYEAELICHMYKAFGTKALPKLRGRFSLSVLILVQFVYLPHVIRRELIHSCTRNVDGMVVIANFDAASTMFRETGKLKTSVARSPIASHLWTQRDILLYYAKEETVSQQEAAAAADAAANALRGLRCASRRSIDLLNRQKCADDDEISIVPSRKLGVPSRGEPTKWYR